MQIEKRLAIFDLDGTLVDSVAQIGAVLNASRASLGYSQLPASFYQDSIGLPLDHLISDLDISVPDRVALVRYFRSNLTETIKCGDNPLFEGVFEGLTFLNENGIKLAIATSKPSEIARLVYENSQLVKLPMHIQGTDDFPAKPNPDVINLVLSKFPEYKAVMVGDRREDMVAAHRAHIPGIGIAASGHSQETLRSKGVIETFQSFNEFTREISSNRLELSQIFS